MVIEKTETFPRLVPWTTKRDARKAIDFTADDVSQRMARERVERKQNDVGEQDQRTDTNPESAVEPERVNRVVPENDQKNKRDVEKVTMQVLQDQWKCGLAAITMRTTLADCACRRIEKESTVVSFAVVVTGCAEAEWTTKDEQRRRERPPAWFKERGIEWRQVWSPFVVIVFKRAPGGVDAESAENDDDRHKLNPPRIASHRCAEPTTLNCGLSHSVKTVSRKGAKAPSRLS